MGAEWMQHVHVPQGFPKVRTDVPPTAVFLFLYMVGAVTHMTIFQINRRRGYKFIFNAACFGFCMARIVTCILRIAWTCEIEDRQLAIAATIFVAAGVLVLFIVNLLFAQRILRGLHPHLGWSKILSRTFLVLYALIPVFLVMVITVTVLLWYTTSPNTARIAIDFQRACGTYFGVFSFLPIPLTIFALITPKKAGPDHFGKGSFAVKAVVVIVASVFLSLGALFRVGTSFLTITPGEPAPWWNAKWCFYFFDFTVEIIVVYFFAAVRIDKLFYVPNGSKGPGDYSRGENNTDAEGSLDKQEPRDISSSRWSGNSEAPTTIGEVQEKV